MHKWLIASIGVFAAGLLLAFVLPPLLERNAVRGCVLAMHAAVRNEDMAGLESHILPGQRALARSLIGRLLPGHGASVDRLRIRSLDAQKDGRYLVHAVVSLDDPNWGRQMYEVQLILQPDAAGWYWDLTGSVGRQFSLADEGGWTKLTDWLNLAQP
jgi:hypothetical protein